MITIHPTAHISHLADIEDSVRGTRITVGAHVAIAANCTTILLGVYTADPLDNIAVYAR